jgi:hypothetical protein
MTRSLHPIHTHFSTILLSVHLTSTTISILCCNSTDPILLTIFEITKRWHLTWDSIFQANKTINRKRGWRNIADNDEHQEEITVLAADNLHFSMFISQNELQSRNHMFVCSKLSNNNMKFSWKLVTLRSLLFGVLLWWQ